jgi:hypothetical protein
MVTVPAMEGGPRMCENCKSKDEEDRLLFDNPRHFVATLVISALAWILSIWAFVGFMTILMRS